MQISLKIQVSLPVNAFYKKIPARQVEVSQINWAQTLNQILLYPSSRGHQDINLQMKDEQKRIFQYKWILCILLIWC